MVRSGVVVSALLGLGVTSSGASVVVAGSAHSAKQQTTAATQQVIVILRTPNPAGRGEAARIAIASSVRDPILTQLRQAHARIIGETNLLDTVTATVTPAEAKELAGDHAVAGVIPNSLLGVSGSPDLARLANTTLGQGRTVRAATPGICGTNSSPELDPQALSAINATPSQLDGIDGDGVTVAILADGIETTNPDLQRNPAYGTADAPVVTSYEDFSGDGIDAPTSGTEAAIDASSVAAQGNETYNLADYVQPSAAAHFPSSGCYIKIVGAAPGADLMMLKVSGEFEEPLSVVLQAIDYAATHGAKVINESFVFPRAPATAIDAVNEFNDAAVDAGVTVVQAAGDAGLSNTLNDSDEPKVIEVGASTTFRAYAQTGSGGFYAPGLGNGRWLNDNVSALSSGGITQSGSTVDLVAPGDLNWLLCSSDAAIYMNCDGSSIQLNGGTSEAAPLVAAAAADVIQAYAQTHHGEDPAPALVKEILTSTASDIGAPAVEQGAGLLDVLAAVKEAEARPGAPSSAGVGGLLMQPTQIGLSGQPGATASQQIALTNSSAQPEQVALSTRALTRKLYDTGVNSFTLDPGVPTTNTGTFPYGDLTTVYQTETFTVPATPGAALTRLLFSADYQDTGQTAPLEVALFEPDGTYAAYNLADEGVGDYAHVEVPNPPAGKWTALFFTAQDDSSAGVVGTSGLVQWDASTWQYTSAGAVSPSAIIIPPGASRTATVTAEIPADVGDSDESVVVSGPAGQTTIPVTIRSIVPIGADGGAFHGVLSGSADSRTDSSAQWDTYVFDVPPGKRDLEASVTLADDPGEQLWGFLVDPDGRDVGLSSNYTEAPSASGYVPAATRYMEIYHRAPEPGQWKLVLDWQQPVTGDELQEPFTGSIQFNQVRVDGSDLPDSASTMLTAGITHYFHLTVENTGVAPEGFFADPRLDSYEEVTLANQNTSVDPSDFALPLPLSDAPFYFVPTHTTQLTGTITRLTGAAPVTFDMLWEVGDPEVSPVVPSPGTVASSSPSGATLTLGEADIAPGYWYVEPDEIGPYPAGGAPTDTASFGLQAITQAFDPTISSNTDDLWQDGVAFSNFLYLQPGQSGTISVDITPSSSGPRQVSGTLYTDDWVLSPFAPDDADELAATPYEYQVAAPGTSGRLRETKGTPGRGSYFKNPS